MEHFVARQPIFNRSKKVIAYELLFRSSVANFFDHADGDQASSRVITDSFLLFGIEEMTCGTKAFINFTRNLIVDGYVLALPPQYTVVEILETVEPDDAVVNAVSKLKKAGFKLALDDFIYDARFEPLLKLADIVKIDFLLTDRNERRSLAKNFLPRGLKLLAEKVETNEDFKHAMEAGYSYFQGYFFSRPVVISRKDVPAFKLHYMKILKEINREEIDFRKLTPLIEGEVSMSYKLLKYINSAAFGLPQKVKSIQQALTFIGEREVKKWATILMLSGMADDKPAELVVTSYVRARFCQLIAKQVGLADRAGDLFLMGLFSTLDAIMDRPLEEVLADMPISDDINGALLEQKGRLGAVLKMILAFERGDWTALSQVTSGLKLLESNLPEAYLKAIQESRQVFYQE
ncbi:MAG: HDOD domain-containing protein [Deltaproteobacteria bacterium]|nr:HDOD domain-containing protein [Deltaproteobacteria bacterium]